MAINEYLLSVILGVVEGLTEFLPVSSTAHLRIAESLFDVPMESGYWKMYTIVIQLGAVLSLLAYFSRRIYRFLATFPKGPGGDRNVLTHPLSLTMVAFVITAVPSFLLTRIISENLENLRVMGWALVLGGIIMWAIDAWFRSPHIMAMDDMNIFQAAWIGMMQILSALVPGTSRSMATIAAGQLVGLSRAAALEFSFFLSLPTMFAATGYGLLKALRHTGNGDSLAPASMDAHQWIVLLIGFVVSFIVAYGVVAWFMNWVRSRGFVPFAIYRIVAGIAVLIAVRYGL